jgi:hypothetical protein
MKSFPARHRLLPVRHIAHVHLCRHLLALSGGNAQSIIFGGNICVGTRVTERHALMAATAILQIYTMTSVTSTALISQPGGGSILGCSQS